MTDWIDKIAARQEAVHAAAVTRLPVWDDVWPLMDDLDRLVALARGVAAMAAALAGEARMTSIVSVKTFKRDMAAELRRLLNGETP